MKIIFLNIWHGEREAELRAFFATHIADTDIFCLQETDPQTDGWRAELLKDFAVYTASKPVEAESSNSYHLATYIRTNLSVTTSARLLADAPSLGLALYTHILVGDAPLHIVNLHGIPRPGKLDTPARIEQTLALLEAIRAADGTVLIGGDLNVLPETQSVALFKQYGYRDLIADYAIPTTRNKFAWEKYPGEELYHSDYIFAKEQNSRITGFEVPPLLISDHLPLILELELQNRGMIEVHEQSVARTAPYA